MRGICWKEVFSKEFLGRSQLKVVSEVGEAGFAVLEELLDGAGDEDFSFADQIASVDDGKDLTGIVVGDQDADSFALEVPDHFFDIGNSEGIDVSERFIEEK